MLNSRKFKFLKKLSCKRIVVKTQIICSWYCQISKKTIVFSFHKPIKKFINIYFTEMYSQIFVKILWNSILVLFEIFTGNNLTGTRRTLNNIAGFLRRTLRKLQWQMFSYHFWNFGTYSWMTLLYIRKN